MKRILVCQIKACIIVLIFVHSAVAVDMVIIGTAGRSAFDWPLYVTLDKSFISSKKVKTKLVTFKDEERAITALADGSIQILASMRTEKILLKQIQDAPIGIVGGLVNKIPFYLVINESLESVEDLKGLLIGIPSFENGYFTIFRSFLEEYGLNYPSDYRAIQLGKDNVGPAAVKYGKTQAAIVSAPFAFQASKEGILRVEAFIKHYPNYLFKVVALNQNWATVHKAQAREFMKGLLNALDWLHDQKNMDEATEILTKYIKIEPDIAEMTYESFFIENQIFLRNAGIDESSIAQVLKNMADYRAQDLQVKDLAKFIDDSYRKAAITKIEEEK